MHKRISFLLIVCSLLVGCASKPAWKEFRSEAGGYSVEMPGTPKEASQNQPTPVGDIAFNSATCEGSGYGFTAAYSDFPEAVVKNARVQSLLEGARDGAVRNVNGKLENSRSLEVEGFPAMELTFSIPDKKLKAKQRIVLVHSRLYQVLAGQSDSSYDEAEIDRFLNSFKLLKK